MKFLTGETEKTIKELMGKYEDPRSALLPILHTVQRDYGYISKEAIEEISEILDIPKVEIKGVITFYSMLREKPAGKYHIQLCRNVACYLNGGKELVEFLEKEYGLKPGTFTDNMKFSLSLVECIGQCEIAPAVQINDKFYGNLTPKKLKEILSKLEG